MTSWVYALALWLAPAANPVADYWRRNMDPLKNPFRGLYQLNGFDLAVMLPYFVVMIVLAAYGMHRYALVYRFFKNRKNTAPPPPEIHKWPKVTVQLPIFNERYVIERLIEAVAQFDYPRELLEIQVLDDSTDETQEIASNCVQRHRDLGLPITYIHRANRQGFKAGALHNGLRSAAGELVAIFDADFIPPADFLRRSVPYFTDPALAMVQTRWSYINRNYSPLTEVEAILLDGHFAIEHSSRYRSGLFFNFNGTAGIWRRAAIDDAGGWQHDTLTEDTDLSYRAQLRGWKFLYVPEIDCPSELPVEMNAFKTQQARWAKGLMQTAKKVLPRVMRSKVPAEVKAEAFFHLTANISYPLMVVLSIILLPAMIVRFYQGWFQVLVIDLPLFLASTCSISSFYLAAERAFYPKTWKRTFLYLPFVMAVGIGLSVRNAFAVIEALFGVQSEFARTPKYRVESGVQNRVWTRKNYRKRAGWMPWVEVGLGLYFAAAVIYAAENQNYATLPFLVLFVWGYLYTGFMSLGQTYFERLRFRFAAAFPAPAPAPAPIAVAATATVTAAAMAASAGADASSSSTI
ncbi:MAG TPA: cellulose synthase family protein [Candidatus Acidoferrales bacterium]|nr:cellulose synthase family protein [Candidatus Acidoferrales bacterium]